MENFILGEYLNYALHDDETPEGGIAYMGETVADFLGDAEEEPKSLEELDALSAVVFECASFEDFRERL